MIYIFTEFFSFIIKMVLSMFRQLLECSWIGAFFSCF